MGGAVRVPALPEGMGLRLSFPLVLALSLAGAGCDSILELLGISSNETLRLQVDGPEEYNALDDDMGLARLEITLTGAIERTVRAEDLPVEAFSVPDKGRVFVETALRFHGEPSVVGVPAIGRQTWVLEPNHRWTLRIGRDDVPPAPIVPSHPDEPAEYCNWGGCQDYWRIEIHPDFRNYEEEALWVVLYGSVPCPEGSICDY